MYNQEVCSINPKLQFRAHAKMVEKLKSKPTFGVGSGPRGPNLGSIRVRLALRLRSSSDFFSVSCCFGLIQSTIIGKKSIQKKKLCGN